jgi:L-amino acid N-acyltransferase YncA
MTEGLSLVIDHAFNEMKLHRLEANIQPENEKSIRLVQRLGFVKEGYSRAYLRIGDEWKDHERWAVLCDDWLARRGRRYEEDVLFNSLEKYLISEHKKEEKFYEEEVG